jgi:16S rRNA (guanine527-N7)-methyltransferase
MMESLRSLLKGAQDLGLTLSPAQLRLFQTYADELVAWNQRLSLTAIISPEEIQVKHFLDSLTCLRALPPGFVCRRVLDVGSGGGFPGLPLKIQDHTLQVTLLESTIKKAEFLRHIVRRLELSGVEVVAERAETLGQTQPTGRPTTWWQRGPWRNWRCWRSTVCPSVGWAGSSWRRRRPATWRRSRTRKTR